MKNKAIKFYIIAIILVLFDQATKLAIKGFNIFGIEHQGLKSGEYISVISDILR
jgi:lipoprotein signal peptidase